MILKGPFNSSQLRPSILDLVGLKDKEFVRTGKKMADLEKSTKDEFAVEHQEADMSQHRDRAPAAEGVFHPGQVAPEAIGGLYAEMPKGYYWSKNFIGTLIVSK